MCLSLTKSNRVCIFHESLLVLALVLLCTLALTHFHGITIFVHIYHVLYHGIQVVQVQVSMVLPSPPTFLTVVLLLQDFRVTKSASIACLQCAKTLNLSPIFPVLAKYENQFSELLEDLPDADEPVWILGECYNVKTSKTCHEL